jgi:4-hydroxy-2-oxoheptanedioate aldolase
MRAAGKAAGILTGDTGEAARYLESGFTFVAVGSDVGILARGSENLAAECKQRLAALVRPVLAATVEDAAEESAINGG